MADKIDRFSLDQFPKMRLGGREFVKVSPRRILLTASGEDPSQDPEQVWIAYPPPDDQLEFPGHPELEDIGPFVTSGIASHDVDRGITEFRHGEWPGGFTAMQIKDFDDLDLYFQCMGVLHAHGWADGGARPSAELLARLESIVGAEKIKALHASDPENADLAIFELAAVHLTSPLSRVWYAANMLALYYIHNDDFRLGILVSEYRIKMRYEVFTLKHMELTEKNRENGAKGGQADRKAERHHTLNEIAQRRFREIAFASDGEGVRLAMRWAAEHDAKAEVPLFRFNGRPLSKKWYAEWLADFRLKVRRVK